MLLVFKNFICCCWMFWMEIVHWLKWVQYSIHSQKLMYSLYDPKCVLNRRICLHFQLFKVVTNANIHTLILCLWIMFLPHDFTPMYECALMIWASYVFEWSKFSLTKSGRIFFFPFLFDFKVSKGYESLVLLFPTICSLLLRKSCEMTRKCQLGTWTDVVVAK